MKTFTD